VTEQILTDRVAPDRIRELRARADELTDDEITEVLAAGYGVMHTLHQDHGDIRKIWDPQEPDDVADARRSFTDLKAKGYMIYRAEGKKGLRGVAMTEFEPGAGRLIAVKRNQGG
jgi:hypothetical protein